MNDGASILVGITGLSFEIGLEITIPGGLASDDGIYIEMPDGVILHDGRV